MGQAVVGPEAELRHAQGLVVADTLDHFSGVSIIAVWCKHAEVNWGRSANFSPGRSRRRRPVRDRRRGRSRTGQNDEAHDQANSLLRLLSPMINVIRSETLF